MSITYLLTFFITILLYLNLKLYFVFWIECSLGNLLQSAARVLQSATVITKCGRNHYKVRQLLQSAAIIT